MNKILVPGFEILSAFLCWIRQSISMLIAIETEISKERYSAGKLSSVIVGILSQFGVRNWDRKLSSCLCFFTGIICVTLGLFLVIFSLGVIFNFDSVFRWVLGRRVVLSANSQGFPIWKAVSDNYDTKVAWHFFNLTNPEEFKKGEMPIVKEVGPFWYK